MKFGGGDPALDADLMRKAKKRYEPEGPFKR